MRSCGDCATNKSESSPKRGATSALRDGDAAAKRRATTAIDDKTRECERLSAEVDALERFGADGARTRERLRFLSDAFERALVHLDGIDSLGDDDVRAARKRAVRFVDALAERVIDMKSRLGEGGEAGA